MIISLLRYWGWKEILICPLSCHQLRIREFRISRLTNSMSKIAAVMLPRTEKSLWRKWRMLTFLRVSSLKPLYYRRKGKEINRDIISLLMGPVNTRLFVCIILFFLYQLGYLKGMISEGNSHLSTFVCIDIINWPQFS